MKRNDLLLCTVNSRLGDAEFVDLVISGLPFPALAVSSIHKSRRAFPSATGIDGA
jgi:hypothetical protein